MPEFKPHTVRSFDAELVGVSALTAEMGGRAEEMLTLALRSIEDRDAELADLVASKDLRLDALELEIEARVTAILALRQPMAMDLRMLLSSLRVASTLERVGDLARNVAQRGRPVAAEPDRSAARAALRLGRRTLEQLGQSLTAYQEGDADLALAVWRRDVEVDDHYASLVGDLVTGMREGSPGVETGSQWLLVAKDLERIGDHATYVAATTWFVAKGAPLGQIRPKGAAFSPGG